VIRRDFLRSGAVSLFGFSAVLQSFTSTVSEEEKLFMASATSQSKGPFWPDGARLVISISMQMEAGAQPSSGAESPMPPINPKYPDLPATKWYEYSFKEGLPHLLDMFDRRRESDLSHGGCSRRWPPDGW